MKGIVFWRDLFRVRSWGRIEGVLFKVYECLFGIFGSREERGISK